MIVPEPMRVVPVHRVPLFLTLFVLAGCSAPREADSPDPGYPGPAAAERARANWALRRIIPEVRTLSEQSYRAVVDDSGEAGRMVRDRAAALRRRIEEEVPPEACGPDERVDRTLALLVLDGVRHRAAPRRESAPFPGVGREEFIWRLRHRHMVEDSPEEIAAEGYRLLAATHREMEEIVSRLYPGLTVREGMDALKDLAPTAEEIPDLARRAMEDARDFVIENDLLTVPGDLRAGKVIPLSPQLAKLYPFGAYGGLRKIDGEDVGVYLVNIGAKWMTPEQRREGRRGNDPFKTRVIAVHEMWPGHHLQRGIAAKNGNPLRREFYTPTYGEGWALYSEELLYRHGHYRDDRTRLAQLGMRRWRCARMVLDPALHLGEMTIEEAVEFLVQRVDLERTNAEAEVRRYLGNPTRPMSYVWGWLEIERLRTDCLAAGMTEKEFHDRFLAAGPIPLPLVRTLLLGADSGAT